MKAELHKAASWWIVVPATAIHGPYATAHDARLDASARGLELTDTYDEEQLP